MAKNILAFFGLIFLTLLIISGVLLMGYFYDSIGIVSLPKGLIETPLSLLTPGPVDIQVKSVGKAEWSNPLDKLPIVTVTPSPVPTEIPQPTATPVPPLEPAEYRGLVLSRMKTFAAALQRWLDANNRLAEDNALLKDPTWTGQMKTILADIRSSGVDLAEVGPAPWEYRGIDAWLKRIPRETVGLQANYLNALKSGDSQAFLAAGSNFTRIKEDLAKAVDQMMQAGWSLQ